MRFSDNLRNLRIQRGITQQELARGLGTSQASITAWENEKREPDFQSIQKIADFFNVPLSALLPHQDNDSTEMISRIVDSMHKDPELCLLFDAQRTMKKEDIQAVYAIVKAIKGEQND